MPDRFYKVTDGLYRGGAPTPEEVSSVLKDVFNINKIVSLDEVSGNTINQICEDLGIEHINIPLGRGDDPKVKELEKIIPTLLENGPTYIHCRHGKDRTGMAVAMFMVYDGWPVEKALQEAAKIGMGAGLKPSTAKSYYDAVKKYNPKDSNDAEDIVSITRDQNKFGPTVPNPFVTNFSPPSGYEQINRMAYFTSLLKSSKRRGHDPDRLQTEENKLKQYVDKGLFFHMTNDYSLQGVNVKTEYDTPLGIYTFPLDKSFFNDILTGNLPFAEDRKYIIIYKPTHPSSLLRTSKYTERQLIIDANTIGYSEEDLEEFLYGNEKIKGDPASQLMFMLYGGDFTKKSLANKRLGLLGYSGIYDDLGLGVIHENEPEQAVFINSSELQIVDIIKNPYRIFEDRKDKVLPVIETYEDKKNRTKILILGLDSRTISTMPVDLLLKIAADIPETLSKIEQAVIEFKSSYDVLRFFKLIDNPNLQLVEEYLIKNSRKDMYRLFARDIPGLNIEKLRESLKEDKKDIYLLSAFNGEFPPVKKTASKNKIYRKCQPKDLLKTNSSWYNTKEQALDKSDAGILYSANIEEHSNLLSLLKNTTISINDIPDDIDAVILKNNILIVYPSILTNIMEEDVEDKNDIVDVGQTDNSIEHHSFAPFSGSGPDGILDAGETVGGIPIGAGGFTSLPYTGPGQV